MHIDKLTYRLTDRQRAEQTRADRQADDADSQMCAYTRTHIACTHARLTHTHIPTHQTQTLTQTHTQTFTR